MVTFAELSPGSVSFGATGTKYFRFLVTGMNPSSGGRRLYLDWIPSAEQRRAALRDSAGMCPAL